MTQSSAAYAEPQVLINGTSNPSLSYNINFSSSLKSSHLKQNTPHINRGWISHSHSGMDMKYFTVLGEESSTFE